MRRFAVIVCAIFLAGLAHAQTTSTGSGQGYPNRPVRVIVPYPAGGGTDIVIRGIQPPLTERLGQQIVVDNRPGAGGLIGAELAARAAPDGYTLLAHTSGGMAIAVHTIPSLRFDPIKDFAPIAHITSAAFVLVVHPKVPATTVKELIAYAKAQPGKLNWSSAGNGSSGHLAVLLFNKLTGTNIVHIPYKGSGPATADLVAGQVQLRVSSIPPAMPHVKSGRLRGIATTGVKRFSLLPDLPAIAETVPGYALDSWYAVWAPAGTPAPIIKRLNADIVAALHTPEAKTRLNADGVEPVGSTPAALLELHKNELAKWAPLVKESGAKPD